MAYIGRGLDKLSNVDVLDIITFTSSAGPYNITKDSVAFVPSTINSLLIEVDGIIQAPASYTISTSTITFGVSMPSTSTMNSMIHFGTGLITVPADGTVSLAKLSATGTKDATTFLRGDNSFQEVTVGSITDQTSAYTNFNEITADRTTTLLTTKNYFLAGTITVADTFTWTIAGSGELNII